MRRDPFQGLSLPARAFVIFVIVSLAVVFGLAIVATFFLDAGPLSKMLGVLAFIGFFALMFWVQTSFARTAKEAADWGGGPLLRALHSTLAALGEQRKSKSEQAEPPEERP
jgi:hypothetical protein